MYLQLKGRCSFKRINEEIQEPLKIKLNFKLGKICRSKKTAKYCLSEGKNKKISQLASLLPLSDSNTKDDNLLQIFNEMYASASSSDLRTPLKV